ncbi:hypothetical protein VF14_20105 [Nostoc linckia z18]|uniref:Uncharacterized protein n=2 Tax=Nostoc linckia TaxID=92942 RepID=A0A9Q6EM57_NOSLI|nr:hypothetical protein VF02_08430 [Nostoc linckia z1]PHJ71631.1 hypothetical protein VF05_06295 [Nostoc linckia z3]PHJ77706.1 hypothetical protein VF03_03420 [Nostoc linckia z2]PHJ86837.1 hypothetical protein VF06_00410 [Nostoc linckia z4]PHJ90532.1 hypothetical protein VF07_08885 [Nostoc linckia z6]PHJ98392.1 hypothetical protein VF04_09635 [Nostoc linckia z7]PHK04760.1 hypothetical protein VF08_10310 [Nostoc linckia z8]PHK09408.1 hypothetical protein VF09_15850 [Nostoc linckia z9]PHK1843
MTNTPIHFIYNNLAKLKLETIDRDHLFMKIRNPTSFRNRVSQHCEFYKLTRIVIQQIQAKYTSFHSKQGINPILILNSAISLYWENIYSPTNAVKLFNIKFILLIS